MPESVYTLVKGGLVIDGSGVPAIAADLLIQDGTIADIQPPGKITPPEGAVVVEAAGRAVTPGFIDAHCHGDPLETPAFENYTAMGVTSLCLGQDGRSPTEGSLADWSEKVHSAGPAPNVVPFAGHGTLRRKAGIDYSPDPSPEQVRLIGRLTAEAMAEGYFGLTTGLEYVPGRVAPMEELLEMARNTGRAGRLIMSHMRSEDDELIDAALDELIEQGRQGGCHVHGSHMKIVHGEGPARAESFLARMDQARAEGVRVTGDIYPYTASCTTIGILFPGWAKTREDFQAALRERRAEMASYIRHRVERRNGPGAVLLGESEWKGQTLGEAARRAGKPFEDFLLDDVGPDGTYAAYFSMDEELQARLMQYPHNVFSSDGDPKWFHPRGYGTFARLIEHFVRERRLFPLEDAIHRMTGATADILGLHRRGYLRAGHAADLLIFDPGRIREKASYTDPHQLAEGFDWVFVNGKAVRRDGSFTAERPGRVLTLT